MKLNIAFWKSLGLVLLLAFALGHLEHFFILFFSVTAHEMVHVLTARGFGLKTESISFTPFGEAAAIRDMELLGIAQKLGIIVSGPCLNIVVGIAALGLGLDRVSGINFALAGFNLLPVYPLDGGRLLQVVVGEWIGIVAGNRVVLRVSEGMTWVLLGVGIVQVVMFPFNISLIGVAFYIRWVNRGEKAKMIVDFFRLVQWKNKHPQKRCIRRMTVSVGTPVVRVWERITYQHDLLVYVIKEEKLAYSLRESEIIDFVVTQGLVGTTENIYESFCK